MKKVILSSALTISTMLAFDVTSSISSVGKALGITAESVGAQLTDIVKAKSPQTAEQAKSYCTQASTYKSFVGIKDGDLMSQAIDICAQKSSEGLEGKVNEVKEKATEEAVKTSPSILDTAGKLLGN